MIDKEHNLYIFKHSKYFLLLIIFSALSSCNNSDPNTRPSPLTKDSLVIGNQVYRTEYSSPSVRKRKIWGELEPFDQVWRTGANDASFIDISSDIILDGNVLPKGKYSFFTIPGKSTWTLIFNKEWKQWGAYSYDAAKDQMRIEVKPQWLEENQEKLKIHFTENEFILRWEYIKVAVDFKPLI